VLRENTQQATESRPKKWIFLVVGLHVGAKEACGSSFPGRRILNGDLPLGAEHGLSAGEKARPPGRSATPAGGGSLSL